MRAIRIYLQVPLAGIVVALALASIACHKSLDYKSADYAKATGASVHGLIYTEVDDPAAPQARRKIFVPGVLVYLKDRASGKPAEPVVTNARGWFATPMLAPGTYSICWEAPGFEPGCATDRDVSVESAVVTPAPVLIRAKGKPIFGRVTFSNGAPCSFSVPVFGLEGNAKVALVDAQGKVLVQPIDTNITGEFIVPDVPSNAGGIRAECDGMKTDQINLQDAKPGALRVNLRNTAPRIAQVYAGSADRPLRRATVYVSTLDLRDPSGARMPGNFGAVASTGSSVRLGSYGGVDVEVRDSAGNRYNLAPGKTATVRIPVDTAALRAQEASCVRALWDYDPQQGIWKQQGTARLKGEFYEATVQHFSAINVAVAANDAACMRLHYDPGTVNFPFQLRITIPLATGADITVTNTVTSSATDVIAGLPPKEPITLQIDTLDASKQTVNSERPRRTGKSEPAPGHMHIRRIPGGCADGCARLRSQQPFVLARRVLELLRPGRSGERGRLLCGDRSHDSGRSGYGVELGSHGDGRWDELYFILRAWRHHSGSRGDRPAAYHRIDHRRYAPGHVFGGSGHSPTYCAWHQLRARRRENNSR